MTGAAAGAGPARREGTGTTSPLPAPDAPAWRSLRTLVVLGLLATLGIVVLTSLGIWQVERRAWKLDLIARIDSRIHAEPAPAPGPAEWPMVTRERDEYRRVSLAGHFLDGRQTLVQAVTERGGGYWVLTPLASDNGFTVLVNRGFVPEAERQAASAPGTQPDGRVQVTGLLRMTEPKGGFLRSNDPAAGRWYSRDVAAIAATKGLANTAPYFVDADAASSPGGDAGPVGGLTVVTLPNNHLVYALTWFSLAIMLAGAAVWVARDEWRSRRGGGR